MGDLSRLIGERLRTYRKERGLSQEELADLSGLHFTYVGKLERAEKNATIESLDKVTKALGITLEDLFRHIQPVGGNRDTFTLAQIINRLQGRSIDDQKTVLKFLELILNWKDK
jgi:transcriptional regulator with XRE-family HTH domain